MSHGNLVPQCRSLAWQSMAEATPAGCLALPSCPACEHRFYPPQRYCPQCLHGRIEYRPDSGAAVVLSMTRLHSTLDPDFQGRLPVHVAAVRTDSGVTLFALADEMLQPGTRVTVCLDRDNDKTAGVLRVRSPQANQDGERA